MSSKLPGYLLSEDDRNTLHQLWMDWQRRNQGASNRPAQQEEGHQAPEMYVILTPTDGIPALTVTDNEYYPGSVECQIYYIDEDLDAPTIKDVDGLTKTVYNLSTSEIEGSQWITVSRDKYGTWIAAPIPGATRFLALLTDKYYLDGQFIAYSWVKVIEDSSTTPVTYTKDTDVWGGPGHNPLFHINNVDYPVVDPASTIVGTGTGSGTGYTEGTGHELSVVEIWRGAGLTSTRYGVVGGDTESGYYLFDAKPWSDLVRRTNTSDADGEIVYEYIYNQNTGQWEDRREMRLVTPT